MSLVVAVTSPSAAEHAAALLRREGFIARAACRGKSPLVVVNCMSEDKDLVVQRVKRMDQGARLLRTA